MSRARALPLDERRKALIEATIPLLLQHGLGVTTRQVADAAGVAEGTIFRAFGSKDDLIHAAIGDAFGHDDVGRTLGALPTDADLRATIASIVAIVSERVTRLRALVGLFHGHSPHGDREQTPQREQPPQEAHAPQGEHAPHAPHAEESTQATAGPLRCARPDPRDLHAQIVTTVAAALEPHADALRVPPAHAASVVLAYTFGVLHPIAGHPDLADPDAVADLLLNGIAKEA